MGRTNLSTSARLRGPEEAVTIVGYAVAHHRGCRCDILVVTELESGPLIAFATLGW